MNTRLVSAPAPRKRASSARGAIGIGAAALTLLAPFIIAVPSASAAVPTFPDNIVVFPDRDFVTIEGYQEYVGQTATLEVTRPGAGVIGSAQSVVHTGDVAFEVNHPGGVCWGAGTSVKVTPDIQAGDKVSLKFGSTLAGDTTAQDAAVVKQQTLVGDVLTVTGRIGGSVNRDQFEQRIIDPAFKDTAIGRRDIRAIPGPLVQDDGYRSGITFSGDTFTATYEFDDAEAAALAADAGGARAMTWEVEDADANRQGLTIAEFGELGGPGMGGCPNGPLTSGPAAPTNVLAALTGGGTSAKVTWTPATAVPGTPTITGYRVHAVAKTVSTSNEQVELGKRIGTRTATGTTITGLTAGEEYDIFVVSVSSAGETLPAASAILAADTTPPPTPAASPAGGTFRTAQQLTLSVNDAGSEIYYTLDGSEPILSGGVVSELATLYRGPVAITATALVRYAAVDPSDNVSQEGEAQFTITDSPLPPAVPLAPAAPTATAGTGTAGTGTATVTWTPADPGGPDLTVTGYTVQAYAADGTTPLGAPRTTAGDVTSVVFDGLAIDTDYRFTVRAANANGDGPESEKSAPVRVLGALVANAGADQTLTRKTSATTVALDGSKSTPGATYKWEQVLTGAGDPDKVTVFSSGTDPNGSFTLPVYAWPMTNNPLTFRLSVTADGVTRTDDVKVAPVPDRVTTTRTIWKSGDLRIEGASSMFVPGQVVTVWKEAVGTTPAVRIGQATLTAAVAPATGATYTLRVRAGTFATTNPGKVRIESNLGGVLTGVTVTNG